MTSEWKLTVERVRRYHEVIVTSTQVPAAAALVDFAGLEAGASVLDAGCGTGAATRIAAERVGPAGSVLGVDHSAPMLAFARTLPAGGAPIEWLECSLLDLPLPDRTFDAVLCAQALQFAGPPQQALHELHRVLKPGGRLAISVWSPLVKNPYYLALTEAIDAYLGPTVAAGLKSAFAFPDGGELESLTGAAGFFEVQAIEREIVLQAGPLATFIPEELGATRIAVAFDAAPHHAREALVRHVETRLGGRPAAVHTRLLRATKR